MNCKIHPVLYRFYLRLKESLGAEIVHRRKRTSRMAIEVIFSDLALVITGRLNTLSEAEEWGFWVMCRPQTKAGHTFYKEHPVFQLFLTPVHPKKRRAMIQHITPLNSTSVAAMIA